MASVSIAAREYLRRLLGVQAVEVLAHLGPALEAPAAGQRHQFDAAALPVAHQLVEQAAQRVGADLVVEQRAHLAQRQRLLRRR